MQTHSHTRTHTVWHAFKHKTLLSSLFIFILNCTSCLPTGAFSSGLYYDMVLVKILLCFQRIECLLYTGCNQGLIMTWDKITSMTHQHFSFVPLIHREKLLCLQRRTAWLTCLYWRWWMGHLFRVNLIIKGNHVVYAHDMGNLEAILSSWCNDKLWKFWYWFWINFCAP